MPKYSLSFSVDVSVLPDRAKVPQDVHTDSNIYTQFQREVLKAQAFAVCADPLRLG